MEHDDPSDDWGEWDSPPFDSGRFDVIGTMRALDAVAAAPFESQERAEAEARLIAAFREALGLPASAFDWDVIGPLQPIHASLKATGDELRAVTLLSVMATLIVRRKQHAESN